MAHFGEMRDIGREVAPCDKGRRRTVPDVGRSGGMPNTDQKATQRENAAATAGSVGRPCSEKSDCAFAGRKRNFEGTSPSEGDSARIREAGPGRPKYCGNRSSGNAPASFPDGVDGGIRSAQNFSQNARDPPEARSQNAVWPPRGKPQRAHPSTEMYKGAPYPPRATPHSFP